MLDPNGRAVDGSDKVADETFSLASLTGLTLITHRQGSLRGSLVSSDGGVDSFAFGFTPVSGTRVASAANESGFLVAWSGDDGGQSDLLIARLESDAGLGPITPLSALEGDEGDVAIASDGLSFFVLFRLDNAGDAGTDLLVSRVTGSGLPIGTVQGVVSAATGTLNRPQATYDGVSVLLSWERRLQDGGVSVQGRFLSTDGGFLESGFSTIAAGPLSDHALASQRRADLLLTFHRAGPPSRASFRPFARLNELGEGCTAGVQCGSGSCVDGVCCNEEFGGNTTADCLACSVARGASANGVCTVFPAGLICRSAAGACDVLEQCNGSSGFCPADALAPVGQACRPSAGACDVAESCTGSAALCPANGFQPEGQSCPGGVCRAGSCGVPVADGGVVEEPPVEEKGCGCQGGEGFYLLAAAVTALATRRRR